MNNEQMENYNKLMEEKGYRAADEYKNSLLPKKLYKYFSLTEDGELNKKKIETLEKNEIWCAHCNQYNDPFEFEALYLDKLQMQSEGYKKEQIEMVEKFYNVQKDLLKICSFSSSSNSMPMWAHYSNNHKGYCIEYEIIEEDSRILGDKIFPVLYTPDRIEGHIFLNDLLNCFYRAAKFDLPATEESLKYTSYMYIVCTAKHISWSYENEYRILFAEEEANNKAGKNVKCSVCGIRPTKSILGYNCDDLYSDMLYKASKNVGITTITKMKKKNESQFYLEELNYIPK